MTETSGTNSVLEAGEPKQRPEHNIDTIIFDSNPEQASPRLSQEGIKVVSGPPGAHTGLKCDQSLIEHISLRQQRNFGEADWKEVKQADLCKSVESNKFQKLDTQLPQKSKHRRGFWQETNKTNWKQIKENKGIFLRDGVLKENFNNIKVKPVKDTNFNLTPKDQRQNFRNHLSPKKSLTSAWVFRKRQRGLQTLCSTFSPRQSQNHDTVEVDFVSKELGGPIMPKAYYQSKLSIKSRYNKHRA